MKKKTHRFLLFGLIITANLIFVQCGESKLQTFMKSYSAFINEQCPMQLDKYSQLTNCMVSSNNTLTYNYSVDIDSLGISADELCSKMKKNFVRNVKSMDELKELRDNGVVFEYKYRKNDGSDICSFTISPTDYR